MLSVLKPQSIFAFFQIGMTMASYSATRWQSKWGIFRQSWRYKTIFEFKPRFWAFISSNVAGNSSSEDKVKCLKLELAAIIDSGEAFVKATYVTWSGKKGLPTFLLFKL